MPGLIDCHVHFGGITNEDPNDFVLEDDKRKAVLSVSQAKCMLNHGYTTVRDISINGFALKYAIDNGFLIGPRIIPCGPGLSRTGGHGDAQLLPIELVEKSHPWAILADTHDEIIKSVRKLIRMDSDFIKVWISGGGFWEKDSDGDAHYRQEDVDLIVEEAKLIGLLVAAYAENYETTLMAAKAGVKSIEHGEELSDDCVALMKEKNIYLVPTLKLILDWDEAYSTTPSRQNNYYGMEPDDIAKLERKTALESYGTAVSAGINICLGSDSFSEYITPYGVVSTEELYYLSDNGLGPQKAIVAATKNGAELLGISDISYTLSAGKKADIIVVDGDSLKDIRTINKENMKMIIKNGASSECVEI